MARRLLELGVDSNGRDLALEHLVHKAGLSEFKLDQLKSSFHALSKHARDTEQALKIANNRTTQVKEDKRKLEEEAARRLRDVQVELGEMQMKLEDSRRLVIFGRVRKEIDRHRTLCHSHTCVPILKTTPLPRQNCKLA